MKMEEKYVEGQQALRERMYLFLDQNPDMSKKEIVAHFIKEGIAKSTIYRIAKRKENLISPKRKQGSGRIAKKMTKKRINKLKKAVNHKHGLSQRTLAKKFDICQSFLSLTLKNKTDIRFRKKIKVPDRSITQKPLVRPKCSFLVSLFRKKSIILDDESYFTLSNSTLNTTSGFYTSNIEETPESIKLARKKTFPDKLLVWIAMSDKGLSRPYIVPSGQAVNEYVYIDKCIRPRLVEFIKTNHKDGQYVFWPDLASSHYSKYAKEEMKKLNINFVPKDRNPACVPELRPIEDFWAQLKRQVYAKGWKAEDLEQLRQRINYAIGKLDQEWIHKLASGTFKRVDAVRREGMKYL